MALLCHLKAAYIEPCNIFCGLKQQFNANTAFTDPPGCHSNSGLRQSFQNISGLDIFDQIFFPWEMTDETGANVPDSPFNNRRTHEV